MSAFPLSLFCSAALNASSSSAHCRPCFVPSSTSLSTTTHTLLPPPTYPWLGVSIEPLLQESLFSCEAPRPELKSAVLRYFAGRGRAEAIRMLLEETQTPFSEVRYTKDTWAKAKEEGLANGTFPFGQVPSLTTHDGKDLVQTYGEFVRRIFFFL